MRKHPLWKCYFKKVKAYCDIHVGWNSMHLNSRTECKSAYFKQKQPLRLP